MKVEQKIHMLQEFLQLRGHILDEVVLSKKTYKKLKKEILFPEIKGIDRPLAEVTFLNTNFGTLEIRTNKQVPDNMIIIQGKNIIMLNEWRKR